MAKVDCSVCGLALRMDLREDSTVWVTEDGAVEECFPADGAAPLAAHTPVAHVEPPSYALSPDMIEALTIGLATSAVQAGGGRVDFALGVALAREVLGAWDDSVPFVADEALAELLRRVAPLVGM